MEIELTQIQTIEQLIAEMTEYPEHFKHLQIFLHSLKESDCPSNFEFLMISPKTFGKIKILDLCVENDTVVIEFIDCAMQEIGFVRVGIHDEKPQVLFIRWSSVKNMVLEDSLTKHDSKDLLEFEF